MVPLAVGITGGIGTGKTEVCKLFASLGAHVKYADEIAKTLIETDPSIRKNIEKQFNTVLFHSDGTFDRKQMAKLIFNDSTSKEKLDAIVHPHVLRKIKQEIDTVKKTKKHQVFMIEAALLYEAKAEGLFDYMIVVDAEEEHQIERVMKRDGSTGDEVHQRIRSQMRNNEKVERADFVIANTGEKKLLEEKCRFLFSLFVSIANSGDKT